jgi:hypothetical protein
MESDRPQHRRYLIHLKARNRETLFQKLAQDRWVDDDLVDQCQFVRVVNAETASRCPVHFSLFRRKHHCRRYVSAHVIS